MPLEVPHRTPAGRFLEGVEPTRQLERISVLLMMLIEVLEEPTNKPKARWHAFRNDSLTPVLPAPITILLR
jgi:hypothetical protein